MKTKAAGIFLINKDNKILVGHPTGQPENVYSIPKGKIELDEDSWEAAKRETWEETNVDLIGDIIKHELPRVNYRHGKKCLYPFVVFEAQNEGLDFNNFDLKCNSKIIDEDKRFEMDRFEWLTFDEAKESIHYTQSACLSQIVDLTLDIPETRIVNIFEYIYDVKTEKYCVWKCDIHKYGFGDVNRATGEVVFRSNDWDECRIKFKELYYE